MGTYTAQGSIRIGLDISSLKVNAAQAQQILNKIKMPKLTFETTEDLKQLTESLEKYEKLSQQVSRGVPLSKGQNVEAIQLEQTIERLGNKLNTTFDQFRNLDLGTLDLSQYDSSIKQLSNNLEKLKTNLKEIKSSFTNVKLGNGTINSLIGSLTQSGKTKMISMLDTVFFGGDPKEGYRLIQDQIKGYTDALNNAGKQLPIGALGRGMSTERLQEEIAKYQQLAIAFKSFFSLDDITVDFSGVINTIKNQISGANIDDTLKSQVENALKSVDVSSIIKGLDSAITNGKNGGFDVAALEHARDILQNCLQIQRDLDKAGQTSNYSGLIGSINQANADLDEAKIKKLQELEEIFNKLDKFNIKSNNSLGSISKDLENFNRQSEQLKSRLTYFFGLNNALNLLRRTARNAFNVIKDLDNAMTQTAVVTEFSVADMWSQLDNYTQIANNLGATTKGAYETMTLFYQQGLNTEQVFAAGIETMKMARIAGIDYAKATDLMTAALRGFNMEINDDSAQRINDVYSKLAAITAADTQEIATAMTKTASIADSAGMSFENTSAFLTQIIETTREAPETAGTALKTVIARFSEVKKLFSEGQLTGIDSEGETIDINKIDTALKTVGLSLNQFILGNEGLDQVFLRLAEKWNTLNTATQRYIATQAAGSRQQSRFIAMMSNYERTLELVSSAENASGASQEQFDKTLDSMEAKLNKLSNSWNAFTMGIANNTMIKDSVEGLTDILDVVNELTGAFGDSFGTFAKLGGTLGIFSTISKAISNKQMINYLLRGERYQDIQDESERYQAAAKDVRGVRLAKFQQHKAGVITGAAAAGAFGIAGAGFGLYAKQLKESGNATDEQIQKFENLSSTATTAAGSIGTITFALSALGASSGVMIAFAAIASVIALIKGGIDLANDSYTSIEENEQKWNNLAALTAKASDKIASSYDNITSSAERYYQLQQNLASTQKGTLEYYKALYEYQDAYDEAIKNGYVDPITGQYDEKRLQDILEKVQALNKAQKAGSSATSYASSFVDSTGLSFDELTNLGAKAPLLFRPIRQKKQDATANEFARFFADLNGFSDEDIAYAKRYAQAEGRALNSQYNYRTGADVASEEGRANDPITRKLSSASATLLSYITTTDENSLKAIYNEVRATQMTDSPEYKRIQQQYITDFAKGLYNTESIVFNNIASQQLISSKDYSAFGDKIVEKLKDTVEDWHFDDSFTFDGADEIRRSMLASLTGLSEEFFAEYDTETLIGLLQGQIAKNSIWYEDFDYNQWFKAYQSGTASEYINGLNLSDEGQRAKDYEQFSYAEKEFINNLNKYNFGQTRGFLSSKERTTSFQNYSEDIGKQWLQSYQNAAIGVTDNLKGIIDVNQLAWLANAENGFNIDQIKEAGSLIQSYGKNFGIEMAGSMNAAIQTLINNPSLFDEFYDNLSDAASVNAISFYKTITDELNSKSSDDPLYEQYNGLLTQFKKGDYVSKLTSTLFNSDDFAEVTKTLSKALKKNGKIDASEILEAAEGCEILADYLELDIVNASTLAGIFSSIDVGNLNISQFNDQLIKAYTIASSVEDAIANTKKSIEDWKSNAPENSDLYSNTLKEAASEIREEFSNNRFASDTLDYYLNLFGLQNIYREFAVNNAGNSDYLKTLKTDYSSISNLLEYISSGKIDMIWANLEDILSEGSQLKDWYDSIKRIINFTDSGFEIVDDVTFDQLTSTFSKGGELGNLLLGLLFEQSPDLKYKSQSAAAVKAAQQLQASEFISQDEIDAIEEKYRPQVLEADLEAFDSAIKKASEKSWNIADHSLSGLSNLTNDGEDIFGKIAAGLGINIGIIKDRFAGLVNKDGSLNIDVFKSGFGSFGYGNAEISSLISTLQSQFNFQSLETANLTGAIDNQTGAICAAIAALGKIISGDADDLSEGYKKVTESGIKYLQGEGNGASIKDATNTLHSMGIYEGADTWTVDIGSEIAKKYDKENSELIKTQLKTERATYQNEINSLDTHIGTLEDQAAELEATIKDYDSNDLANSEVTTNELFSPYLRESAEEAFIRVSSTIFDNLSDEKKRAFGSYENFIKIVTTPGAPGKGLLPAEDLDRLWRLYNQIDYEKALREQALTDKEIKVSKNKRRDLVYSIRDIDAILDAADRPVNEVPSESLEYNHYRDSLTVREDENGEKYYILTQEGLEQISADVVKLNDTNNQVAESVDNVAENIGDNQEPRPSYDASGRYTYSSLEEYTPTIEKDKKIYDSIATSTAEASSKVANAFKSVTSAAESLVNAQEKLKQAARGTLEWYQALWDYQDTAKQAKLNGAVDALGLYNENRVIVSSMQQREAAQVASVGQLMAKYAKERIDSVVDSSMLEELGIDFGEKTASEIEALKEAIVAKIKEAESLEALETEIKSKSKKNDPVLQTLQTLFTNGDLNTLYNKVISSDTGPFAGRGDVEGLINTGNPTWDSIVSSEIGFWDIVDVNTIIDSAGQSIKTIAQNYEDIFDAQQTGKDANRRALLKNLGIDADLSQYGSQELIGLISSALYNTALNYEGVDLSEIFQTALSKEVDYSSYKGTKFKKIQDSWDSLSDWKKTVIENIGDYTSEQLDKIFSEDEFYDKTSYQSAYKERSIAARNNLTGRVDSGNLEWLDSFSSKIAINTIGPVEEELSFISDNFGANAANEFSKTLGELASAGSINDFVKNWTDSIDVTNIITAYHSVLKESKKVSNAFNGQYKTLLDNIDQIPVPEFIKALIGADDFKSTWENLQGIVDTFGEIDGSSILEAADGCELLNDLLNDGIATASALAAILGGISLGRIDTSDITNALVQALGKAAQVKDYVAQSMKWIDEWSSNRPDSGGVFEESFVETASNLWKSIEKGWYGDSTIPYDLGLFGLTEEWNNWVATLPDNLDNAGFIKAFNQQWKPFFDIMSQVIDDDNASAIWKNLDTLLGYNVIDANGNTVSSEQFKDQLSGIGFKINDDGSIHIDDNADFNEITKTFESLGAFGKNLLNVFLKSSPDAQYKWTKNSINEAYDGMMGDYFSEAAYQEFLNYASDNLSTADYNVLLARAEGEGGLRSRVYAGLNEEEVKTNLSNLNGELTAQNLASAIFGQSLDEAEASKLLTSAFGQGLFYQNDGKLAINEDVLVAGLSKIYGDNGAIVTEITNAIGAIATLSTPDQDKANAVIGAINDAASTISSSIDELKPDPLGEGEGKGEGEGEDAAAEAIATVNDAGSELQATAGTLVSAADNLNGSASSLSEAGVNLSGAASMDRAGGFALTNAAAIVAAGGAALGLAAAALVFKAAAARHGKIGSQAYSIPGYAKGRSIPRLGHINTKPPRNYEGVAQVGEEGPELVVGPNGTYLAGVHGQTFTYLHKDDSVYTAQQTRKILGNTGNAIPGFASGTDKTDIPGFAGAFNGISRQAQKSSSKDEQEKKEQEQAPYENKLDKLQNLIEHIDKTTRNIEQIEHQQTTIEFELEHTVNKLDYNKLWSDFFQSYQDTLEKQNDQIKNYQARIEGRKLEINKLMYDQYGMQKYAYYDEDLDEIVYDWAQLEKVKDADAGKKIDDYIDELEKYVEDMHDSQDEINKIEEEIQKAQEQLEKKIGEQEKQYRESIDDIRDAIADFHQDEIDKLSELSDAQDENNNKILENMQKVIDEQRRLRDLQESKDDLEEKQRRLQLLRRDSSGANAVEIKKLEEEIEKDQEGYVDSLVDYSLEQIQESNDVAAEQRQQQIDLLQEILDFQKENGYFNQQAEDLFDGLYDSMGNINWESDYVKLMQWRDKYDAMTLEEQEEWRKTFEEDNVLAQAGQLAYNDDYNTNLWNSYKEARDAGELDPDILMKLQYYWSKDGITAEDLKDIEKIVPLLETAIDKWSKIRSEVNDNVTTGELKKDLDKAEKNLEKALEKLKEKDTIKNHNAYDQALEIYNTKKHKYDTAVDYRDMYDALITQAQSTLSNDYNIDYETDLGAYNKYLKSQQPKIQSGPTGGYWMLNSDDTYSYFNRSTGGYTKANDEKTKELAKGGYYKKEDGKWTFIPKAATGGLFKTTGLMQIDGTASKPELVLRPSDTKNFLSVIDILRGMDISSLGSGTTYYDIHIDVDRLSNDYDVEQVANKIKSMITSDASYRNNNVLNFIR